MTGTASPEALADGRVPVDQRTVLHVVEATFAGVGRHVLDLVGEQGRAGHDVHVAYSPGRESESFARERLLLTEVSWHEVPMSRGLSPSDRSALTALRRITSTISPDVVHGHSTKGGLLARLLPGPWRVLYTPNAVYSMNPLLSPAGRRAVALVERLLAIRTDKIIAVSPEERSHLLDIGVATDKVAVVPNGIADYAAPSRDDVRREYGLPADVPIIGFVGRLDEQKAPDVLARVADRVTSCHSEANFAIVGHGPLQDRLLLDLDALDARRPRVTFLGEQPGRHVMASFDVFLLPSRYEGFPYVLLEAAYAGIPIVTTDRANASLLKERGLPVTIVPYDDTEALANAVLDHLSRSTRSGGRRRTPGFDRASPFHVASMADDVAALL